jgi:hypothetical protein
MGLFDKFAKKELEHVRKELELARARILEVERERHEIQKSLMAGREELETLKMSARMEEREIKQLVKMSMEKNEVEFEKKKQELLTELTKSKMEIQTEYHNKVVQLLEKGQTQLMDIYKAIMERLPNVNMEINRDTVSVKKEG